MKKAGCAILLIALILSLYPHLTASAESLYVQKFVSVVYDDSGSVHVNGSKNWSYANYAMQSFCGLLNSQDKLFITYLSQPDKPVQINLASDRQQAVNGIREHTVAKGTPYSAIDNAFNVLSDIPGSNRNTQYWLVIITDGVFVKQEKTQTKKAELINKNDINTKINQIADKRMPNGSKIKITYLAIGQDAISPDPVKEKNIIVYPEQGDGAIISEEKIVSVMSKIADKVSGKTRLTSKQITFIDKKTVKVQSKIKLVNIAVLSQKSSAKLLSAKILKGSDLNLEQSVSVRYPEVSGWVTDKSLNGTVSLICNSGENIEAGTYILSFSEAVDTSSLDILFEPALEVRMKISSPNGQEIMNVDSLLPNDTIDITYKLFETGTNKEIIPAMLDSSVKYDLSYFEDGVKIRSDTTTSRSLYGVKLREADTIITSSIVIQGFEPIISSVEFKPEKPVVYTIDSIENTNNTIVRRDLYINKKAVQFYVLADGVRMTKADLAGIDIKYTTNKYKHKLAIDTVILNDGTVCCAPRFDCWRFPTRGFWNWSSTWLFSCCEFKIFADIAGKEMEAGKVRIVPESLFLRSFNYIVLAILLFFIYGYIFKPKFKMGSKIYYITAANTRGFIISTDSKWEVKEPRRLSFWTFVPWVKNRITISGITFYAMGDGFVGVLPRRIGKDSRRLTEKMTNENSSVNIHAAAIKSTFVSASPSELSKQPMQQFSSGEGLLNTSDMLSCTIFKYEMNKRKASYKEIE